MGDKELSGQRKDNDWTPDAATAEVRSLDDGESGQFAPGGYDNQQTVNEPRRRSLYDDIVPPCRC